MKQIPIIVPDITDEDIQKVVTVLKSGNLVHGENCLALEKVLANKIGVSHSSMVSNGTASLIMALKVLGVGDGDEVIVPAFSFVATANAVELVGATPVFVDVEHDTFNISVNAIENKITNRTRAIIPVHEFGLACDIEKVMQIAKANDLAVVEDAACALGASVNGKMIGSYGDLASFSLHPRKAITCGEGGVITTNNSEYAKKVNQLRNHGIEYGESIEFVEAGYNFRLTDFQAAMVLSQLDRFEDQIKKRRTIASNYQKEITSSLLKLPIETSYTQHTWQTYHLVLDNRLNREEVINELKNKKIGSGPGAQCIPEVTYYKKKYNLDSKTLFPNALKAYYQGLVIPLYGSMEEYEVEYIVDSLNQIKKR